MIPYGPQQLHGCSHLQTQTLFYRGTSCIHEGRIQQTVSVFGSQRKDTSKPLGFVLRREHTGMSHPKTDPGE